MVLSEQRIAIIGAGSIGRALIGGMRSGDHVPAAQIHATRRTAARLDELQGAFPGIAVGTDNTAAVAAASVVVLSIKPQQAAGVINEIAPHVSEETLIISVLAGLTTHNLAQLFGLRLPVVRAMPNTPALVDAGATALAAGTHCTEAHRTIARTLFEAVGTVEDIDEYLMDAVTGVSGSGPAYVFMFIEALTDAGVKQGLPRATAARLAAQTVYGASKLVLETGKHPAILRDEVTTPGGTAIAATSELESHGLRTMLIKAVATATARSQHLSSPDD
jgi:pyrroline-5-carboxylate reductase